MSFIRADLKSAAKTITLGENLYHCLIPAGTWQRAHALDEDVLVSCVVSPAYRDEDCIIYEGEKL